MIETKVLWSDNLSDKKELLDKNIDKNNFYKKDILNLENNIVNQEKVEKLLSSLKWNESFKKFSNIWDSFSDKEKLDVYNDWAYMFKITWGVRRNVNLINPIKSPFRSPLIRAFQKGSIKEQMTKDSFYVMSAATRSFVHFWLLSKPNDLTQEDLIKNIKKDWKNVNMTMNVLEKTAMIVPQLRPVLPVIKTIKPIVKSSSNMTTDLMLKASQTA